MNRDGGGVSGFQPSPLIPYLTAYHLCVCNQFKMRCFYPLPIGTSAFQDLEARSCFVQMFCKVMVERCNRHLWLRSQLSLRFFHPLRLSIWNKEFIVSSGCLVEDGKSAGREGA